MLAFLLVLSVLVPHPGACVLQRLYCSISDSCECDFRPNIRGLEWDLYKNVYGQHLAQDLVSEEVARFVRDQNPDRPLVLSFHGSSGTGKTLVGSMLGRHLYGSAMSSPFVHQLIPALHFPPGADLDRHRENLKSWVQGNLTECARSVFILDQVQDLPPGLLDVLEPFLGPSHVVFRTNYRKAIYVLVSTAGEDLINAAALEQRRSGREREEIRAEDLQDALVQTLLRNRSSGFFNSSVLQRVTRFVPFLPLSRRHVERCVQAQLCLQDSCQRSDVVASVGGAMTYEPQPGHFFSTTGCKTVPAKINYYL